MWWHKDLIGALPVRELEHQVEECFETVRQLKVVGVQPWHRKLLEYPADHFYRYTDSVVRELWYRGVQIDTKEFEIACGAVEKLFNQDARYFQETELTDDGRCHKLVTVGPIFPGWHNREYLDKCYERLAGDPMVDRRYRELANRGELYLGLDGKGRWCREIRSVKLLDQIVSVDDLTIVQKPRYDTAEWLRMNQAVLTGRAVELPEPIDATETVYQMAPEIEELKISRIAEVKTVGPYKGGPQITYKVLPAWDPVLERIVKKCSP